MKTTFFSILFDIFSTSLLSILLHSEERELRNVINWRILFLRKYEKVVSMKIYISQPYAYKSDEEIVKVRNDIIKELHAYMKDIEILDSVIQIEQTFGLKQLSESILVLSDADAIIFAPGWEESRGCRIEHMIAEEFHMHIIHLGN